MGLRLALLGGWLMAASIASAEDATEPSGSVVGYVLHAVEGHPLQGVTIRVQGQPATETQTDADGRFSVVLPPGDVVLIAESEAFGTTTLPVVVVEDGMESELLLSLDAYTAPLVQLETPRPMLADVDSTFDPTNAVTVEGFVLNDAGDPIPNANVFARGQPNTARTDLDGRFELLVTPGATEISVLASGYESRVLPVEVEAAADAARKSPLNVTLVEQGLALSDFTVSAPRIEGAVSDALDERKNSSAVSEVLGAEQMSKSGDSNAASALKRVTGLTVVGGKFVYVRGLGERYSQSLLNGSSLPSPEPEKRVVPLDLFSADLLESVAIQKTFSPDKPAEFGGGTVELRTKNAPDDPFIKIGISGGYRHGTTFTDGPRGISGPTDLFGVNGGFRSLSPEVQEATQLGPIIESNRFSDEGFSADALEVLGESVPNRWDVDPRAIPPDFGIEVSAGTRVPIQEYGLGVIGSVGFDNGWSRTDFERTYHLVGQGNELEVSHRYQFDEVKNDISIGGIFGLSFEFPNEDNIRATTILIRSTENGSRVYEGFNRDVGSDIRVSRLRWEERQLLIQQLEGNHDFDVLRWKWRYAYANARRIEPDRREFRQDREGDSEIYLLSDRPEGNQIFDSTLTDHNHDFGTDLTVPFPSWTEHEENHIQFGASAVIKDREVDTRRFKFFSRGPLSGDSSVISLDPSEAFAPEFIGTDGFQFGDFTRETDNYTAQQRIRAGYAMTRLGVVGRLSAMAGVRVEHSDQNVTTFAPFNPDLVPVVGELTTTDILPGVTLTQGLGPVVDGSSPMLLRAGYGKTVSRPDFRELSPATFNDVTGGRQTFGNADLERATIDNFDIRWEWYPSEGEAFSVGAFYKFFDQPIEQIVVVSAQHSVTFENADSANNLGLEFDVRTYLDWLSPVLRDFSLASNLSLIRSRITLAENAGIQTSDVRALQGQSPYVLNVQVGWDQPNVGSSVSLLYNVAGPRIEEVGALGAPDSTLQPFHQLDLVAKKDIGGGFKASVKAQNLLDARIVRRLGDETSERYRRGWSIGLGLSWGS